MTDYFLAGVAVALLSLIFSKFPFIQLVYFLAVQGVTSWDGFGMITGIMLIATFGATVYHNTSK